jgi:6,7-dimethyl-8-ribityllumazine synthase
VKLPGAGGGKGRDRNTGSARGMRVMILRSAFNAPVVDGLLAGAREALLGAGLAPASLGVVDVPGAFELPLAAKAAAVSGRYDAVIALGAVIRGDTDHYEHIAREAASGLSAVARETGVPVAFGVLTVTDEAQARARSAPGEGNKGVEAARAAITMVHVLRALARGPGRTPRTQPRPSAKKRPRVTGAGRG